LVAHAVQTPLEHMSEPGQSELLAHDEAICCAPLIPLVHSVFSQMPLPETAGIDCHSSHRLPGAMQVSPVGQSLSALQVIEVVVLQARRGSPSLKTALL
jgi:hypothetical protein